jgi:hypothetical protein
VKTLHLLCMTGLTAALLLAPRTGWAQNAPVIHGDVSGLIGSQSIDGGRAADPYASEFEHSFFGAISAGWHWTDQLKTEIDFGGGTQNRDYRGTPLVVEGRQTYRTTETTFSRRTLGIGQQYQFFRNASFHPHVGAGAHLSWQRSRLYVNPIVIYDDLNRTGRVVAPARTEGPVTRFIVNPFVESGFKAYMTKAAFFRSDLRVAFRGGVDEVLVRFGFGVDF